MKYRLSPFVAGWHGAWPYTWDSRWVQNYELFGKRQRKVGKKCMNKVLLYYLCRTFCRKGAYRRFTRRMGCG